MADSLQILLATFNGERYLKEQLDSLFSQTYQEWLLIIHDDNSTDGTVNIVLRYLKRYPDKIIYIDDDKCFGSASGNFSFLLHQANADYIMFCDQDDAWMPDKIEKSLRVMKINEQQHPDTPLLLHTDLEIVDDQLNRLSTSFWKYHYIDPNKDALNRLLMQNTATGCTFLMNKQLATMSRNIPDSAIMHDWWITLIASSMGRIIVLPEPTVYYRQHHTNDTGASKFNMKYIISRALPLFLGYEREHKITMRTIQAQAFHQRFHAHLGSKQNELLERFSLLTRVSWLKRCQMIYRYHFYQIGLIRNIRLFLPYD